MQLDLNQLQKIISPLNHVVSTNPALSFHGVSTDTRTLQPNQLFVALTGPNFDGHAFLQQASEKGARIAVVERLQPLSAPIVQIQVPSSLQALQKLGQYWRQTLNIPVVAVTGSNGKTTTKDILATALAVQGPVHATSGNLNNAIGVPLTLCACPHDAVSMVVEMGMNARGEIAELTQMATPNVGIITCIAEAHLGGPGLGSLAAIAAAKLELFEHLSPQGICILNQDDAWLNQLAPAIIQQRPCVRVGTAQNNDIQIVDIRGETAGTTMQLRIDSQYHNCWIPLIGRHQAYNSALALAAAWTQNIDIVAAINQLKHLKPIQHRLSILHFPEQSFTLIDDCYNANPGSMKAALATALQYQQGRLLMVCGDMLELGIHAETLHIELGRQIAEDAKAHMLWAVGDYAKYVCDAAQTKGTQSFAFTSDVPIKKLTEAICTILQPGDVLLVKGSRGARLERLVESIQFTLNKAEK